MGQILTKLFDFLAELFGGAITPAISQKTAQQLEQEREDNERLRIILEGAESRLDARFEENACPAERIENFRILGFLCGGAFGAVFKVRQRDTRTEFALKVQPKCIFTSQAQLRGVLFEKRLTFALQNEFAVRLHYAFQDAKKLYMVLEYARYGDFTRIMEANVSEESMKLYAAQMILGIEYLHACNILHRDLKPQNIFVFDDFYIKLGDFGLAKKLSGRTYTSVGTPAYMAPEMFQGKGFGKAVDWWALGIILYKLMHGDHPFCKRGATNKQEISRSVQQVDLRFPSNVDANAPHNKLLRGLLQKKSHRRLGALKGGGSRVRQHHYFNNISFLDVLQKAVRLDLDIESVLPRRATEYPFLTEGNEDSFDPDQFPGF